MFDRLRNVWRSLFAVPEIPITEDKRSWSLYPYGGGAAIVTSLMTREEAQEHCAKHHGTVTYTDVNKAFIFYKPFGWR